MNTDQATAGTYWSLVADGEPYRLLFPVGAAIGVFGVVLWPFYFWEVVSTYPGTVHARIMVEGFLTAFVLGFLGTALPRLLGMPGLNVGEALALAGAVLWLTWLHATDQSFWGDQIFAFTLLSFAALLGVRAFLFRRDVPPPAFMLVALGMAGAVFGAGSQAVLHAAPLAQPPWMVSLGRLLLYQGYLVFPVMGVGAFLLPRFFGLSGRQDFPESLVPPAGWWARAGFALLCGGLVMLGFVVEATGDPHWGNGLRAFGISVFLLREVPAFQKGAGGGSLAFGLRCALISIPLAYGLMAIWPELTYSFLHVLYISGLSLLTFIVASRVILGHSGESGRLRGIMWPVRILTALVILAMLTRVSADWMPDSRVSHYAYAAIVWIAGVGVWAAYILPKVRRGESRG
ncbi:MAG: NnrS family protein [Verrucomicrobiota bacterium]